MQCTPPTPHPPTPNVEISPHVFVVVPLTNLSQFFHGVVFVPVMLSLLPECALSQHSAASGGINSKVFLPLNTLYLYIDLGIHMDWAFGLALLALRRPLVFRSPNEYVLYLYLYVEITSLCAWRRSHAKFCVPLGG